MPFVVHRIVQRGSKVITIVTEQSRARSAVFGSVLLSNRTVVELQKAFNYSVASYQGRFD